MTPFLLSMLADPETGEPVRLANARYDETGSIVEGELVSSTATYPIRNGIPRFAEVPSLRKTVHGFGDQWNQFNFTRFRDHWLEHTVRNTFGSVDSFRGKLIVDAGGGSGAQTLWMLQAGARHVILLDLSHSVDDVVQRNLRNSGFTNYDVVQCSIDRPPIRANAVDGLVICHNVIQHTRDVAVTAQKLYEITAPGGEFVFNCYERNDTGVLRKIRWFLYWHVMRRVLPRLPSPVRHGYAMLMAVLREVPLLGPALEKFSFCSRGDVPRGNDSLWRYMRRRLAATVLNTYDLYGSHAYQHHLSNEELKALVHSLQPEQGKVINFHSYFGRPRPRGCALRVVKS